MAQNQPIGSMANTKSCCCPDETLAKLPDRQHLLNEMEDSKRIQDAIDQAYREALIERKAQLAAAQFVEHYAHLCLNSSNADLLNDVPFVPRGLVS